MGADTNVVVALREAAIVVAVVGAGIFGTIVWIFRDKWRDLRALLTMLVFMAALPMAAVLVQQKTNLFPKAEEPVTIVDVGVNKTNTNELVLYLTLSESAFAYLEYTPNGETEKSVIIPIGPVQKRVGHAFEIKKVGKGGNVAFIVNGRPLLWQEKPFEVK